jgi:hypothetical protein
MEIVWLPLGKIRTDGATQARERMDLATVADYAADYLDGIRLPPGVVFFDGECFWLACGFHRYRARVEAGFLDMECEVRKGTLDDARWYAAGTNKDQNALRRSNADKRIAVEMALRAKPTASDSAIAEQVGVDHKTVGSIRRDLGNSQVERTGRDGRTIDTSNIGRREESPTLPNGAAGPPLGNAAPDLVPLNEQGLTEEEVQCRAAVLAGNAIVVNLKTDERLVRWAEAEGLLERIDRRSGSDWANPFPTPEDGSRDEVCDRFAVYLAMRPSLQARLSELAGKVLACWCDPQRCHGHHLAALVNAQGTTDGEGTATLAALRLLWAQATPAERDIFTEAIGYVPEGK